MRWFVAGLCGVAMALLPACGDAPLEAPGGPAAASPDDSAGGETAGEPTGPEVGTPPVVRRTPPETTTGEEPPRTEPTEPIEPVATPPGTLAGCDPSDGEPWTTEQRLEDGPFRVGTRDFTFVDPSRPTMANGIFPESDSRTLQTTVWYPAKAGLLGDLTPSLNAELAREAGPFPLVVHAHGFMSERKEVSYLAKHLATHGYVVVSANFPLSTMGSPGGPTIDDVVNQPGDVSFLIDNMIGHSMSSDSPLFGAVDAERIAITGTSLGALTTFLVTHHPDLRDPRIGAAITYAGPAFMFTELFWNHAEVPILLVHGDIDVIIEYEANAVRAFERAAPMAGLVTILGGTHTGFAAMAALLGFAANPDEVGCATIAGALPEDQPNMLLAFVDEEKGIVAEESPPICPEGELPPSMAVSRQHQLTIAASRAFLELNLSTDSTARASACRYLVKDLEPALSEEIRVDVPN